MSKSLYFTNLLKLNYNELIFDIVLFAYSEFFLYKYIASKGLLINLFQGPSALITGMFIDFFIIWYMGVIFTGYKKQVRNPLILAGIIAVMFWIVMSLHFGMAFNIYEIFSDRIEFHHMFTHAFVIMAGMIGGIIFAVTEPAKNSGKPYIEGRVRGAVIMVIMTMTILNIYIAYYLNKALGTGSLTAGILIWAALTGFVSYLCYFISRKIKKAGYDKHANLKTGKAKTLKKILFSVLVVTMLCLWEEIYIWAKIFSSKNSGDPISSFSMIIYLIFSGVIPMRILIALEPPVNLLNLLIGAFSTGYFLYSVSLILN